MLYSCCTSLAGDTTPFSSPLCPKDKDQLCLTKCNGDSEMHNGFHGNGIRVIDSSVDISKFVGVVKKVKSTEYSNLGY